MTDINPKPETIRNRILDAVKNRLETVVQDYYVRVGIENERVNIMTISLDGVNPDLGRDWNRVFKFTVTGPSALEYQEWSKDEEIALGDGIELTGVVDGYIFPLLDTGRNVTLDFEGLTSLPENGTFEIHLGNRMFSLRGAYRWDRVVMNKVTPSIVVFPQKETKTPIPNDRYDCTLDIALTLWVESEPEGYSQIEEYLGEIINVLSADITFGDCLNYDSEVTEVQIQDADGTSEALGAYIELIVKYRHDVRDTRKKR